MRDMNMRYERQVMMDEIGTSGQKHLESAKVAVVGAGGLGSAVLYYLAAAGIGEITVIDYDFVELSNLNRQIIHWEKDIGRAKVFSAKEKMEAYNSSLTIHAKSVRLNDENAEVLLDGHQVLIDCVDNVETRLIVNKWGNRLNIPIVEGGVQGYTGFVMNIKRHEACLCCIWGDLKNTSGTKPVLGAAAGIIGSLQAMQCIKILTVNDQDAYSKMWVFDFMSMNLQSIEVQRGVNCPICGMSDDL